MTKFTYYDRYEHFPGDSLKFVENEYGKWLLVANPNRAPYSINLETGDRQLISPSFFGDEDE